MRVPQWVKRFTVEGRTGAYLSVVVPGTLEPGVEVQVERPDHDIDLLTTFRAAMGDLDAAGRVLDAVVLHPDEHAWLAAKVSSRQRG
jgi:MOSC domain-containing protein YiiM